MEVSNLSPPSESIRRHAQGTAQFHVEMGRWTLS
jgi:hypothetical protein